MLLTHVAKEFFGGSSAAGLHVVVPSLDALNGLIKILAFPFQIGGESLVERIRWRFATLTCEFFQFRLPLGF